MTCDCLLLRVENVMFFTVNVIREREKCLNWHSFVSTENDGWRFTIFSIIYWPLYWLKTQTYSIWFPFCKSFSQSKTSEERTVKHFHFTAWPDHGVPQGTEVLIQFRGLVRQHIQREGAGAPTVVHCRYVTSACLVLGLEPSLDTFVWKPH